MIFRQNHFFLALLVLLSVCFSVKGSTLSRKSKQVLKVMSYNVYHCSPPSTNGKIDVAAIAKVINAEKPDLVALQEIDVHTPRSGKDLDQAKELGRLTGMHAFFSKGIDLGGGEYGVAVLSRYPLEETFRMDLPVVPDSKGEPRTLAAVKVRISKKQALIFASTHLDLKEVNRINQTKQIIERFKEEKLPVILAGDFNTLPNSGEMKMFDQYFTRTCLENCGGTFPVVNPDREIDYIMYRPAHKLKVISHKVIDEQFASDHLPVVAEIEVK